MSVAALLSVFQQKLDRTRDCLLLRDAHRDASCHEMLRSVQDAVCEMEIMVTVLRKEISSQRQTMDRVKVLKSELSRFMEQTQHSSDNIPTHLPLPTREISPPDAPAPPQATIHHPTPSQNQPPPRPSNRAAPSVNLLTVEEFNAAPKYMKGRLAYKQMCSFVEEFNKALSHKHKILTTPRQKQTIKIKNQIVEFKEQESKHTDGFFFVTDSDLTSTSQIKLDPLTRNCLTILRHCGRLKEHREGKAVKYLVSPHMLH